MRERFCAIDIITCARCWSVRPAGVQEERGLEAVLALEHPRDLLRIVGGGLERRQEPVLVDSDDERVIVAEAPGPGLRVTYPHSFGAAREGPLRAGIQDEEL